MIINNNKHMVNKSVIKVIINFMLLFGLPAVGPMKSPMSVCPSVWHFSQEWALVFSDFLCSGK